MQQLFSLEQIVWPDVKIRELKEADKSSSHFTLPAGSHSFPFRLQFPMNNASCSVRKGDAFNSLHAKHVTQVLPPTFSLVPTGFSGVSGVEIRYLHRGDDINT